VAKLAITGVELVDPESALVRRATLLVEDGRIAGSVEPGARSARIGAGRAPGALRRAGFLICTSTAELVAVPAAQFAAALERAGVANGRPGDDGLPRHHGVLAARRSCDAVVRWPRDRGRSGGGPPRARLHLEGPWISAEAPGAIGARRDPALRRARRSRGARPRGAHCAWSRSRRGPGADALSKKLGARARSRR